MAKIIAFPVQPAPHHTLVLTQGGILQQTLSQARDSLLNMPDEIKGDAALTRVLCLYWLKQIGEAGQVLGESQG